MARHLDMNCLYSAWSSQWDWAMIGGRSLTKWGVGSNYSATTVYNSSDLRLSYSPTSGTVYELIATMSMTKVRAILGYRAIILSALLRTAQVGNPGSETCTLRVAKLFKPYPDVNSVSYQYKDVGDTTPWYQSGYAPQFGHDEASVPIATCLLDSSLAQYTFYNPLEMKDYVQYQLLRGDDLWLDFWQQDTATSFFISAPNQATKPWAFDLYYLFPVEMFPVGDGGVIDLTRLLNVDNEPLDLGAYQRNQTGTGVQFKLKNFSDAAITHVEVWDDHPQWSEPQPDAGNSGTADLAYAGTYEACVSQRWEIKFLTSTTYEVKATAYLDNTESLHPSYDANPSWQGAVGSDFDDPEGNITIPTAGWSGTASVGDLIVFYTRGNTTDASWPEDSNDQVEVCGDNAGSPDGDWRPINGRRTESTASVTIDSTTKTVSVLQIVTADWDAGTPCFIANGDTIDEGTINAVTATSVTIDFASATSNVYAAGAIVATTLPIRDLAASEWGQLSADSGGSETYPDRVYIANASDIFTSTGVTVFIQSVTDPDTSEEGVIYAIQPTYIQLTGNLTNDYEAGDFCARVGQGEASFWLRVVASGSTDEELKELRLNVIA